MEEQDLIAEALSQKAGYKVEISAPSGARSAISWTTRSRMPARRWAASSPRRRRRASCWTASAAAFKLEKPPQRIEVYDNSHIMGTNAVGGMIVAGPEGFRKSQYRKFNIKSADLVPGDDYGMMREVLRRRFSRLLREARAVGRRLRWPRWRQLRRICPLRLPPPPPPPRRRPGARAASRRNPGRSSPAPPTPAEVQEAADEASPWPDLVLIDGGLGQLNAARAVMDELGITDVPMVGIAKGLDREAGREQFFIPGPAAVPHGAPRSGALFHPAPAGRSPTFAIGSHRARRKKDISDARPSGHPRRRPDPQARAAEALRYPQGDERASLADLEQVPGVNASTARPSTSISMIASAREAASTCLLSRAQWLRWT